MSEREQAAAKLKNLRRIEGHRHAREVNFTCFQERPFLQSERARCWFVESAKRALHEHDIRLWAYVIMPTHVHLLLFPRQVDTRLSDFLFSLKRSVAAKAIEWTRRNAPSGLRVMLDRQPNGKSCHRFWQRGGGFDRNLWSEDAIWNMIEYIHMNPVEAGLCTEPSEWPWSSAGYYRDLRAGPLELDIEHLPWRS